MKLAKGLLLGFVVYVLLAGFSGCASQPRYATQYEIETRNIIVFSCLDLLLTHPKVDCSDLFEHMGYTKSYYRDSPYNSLYRVSTKKIEETPLWEKILIALVSAKASSHHSSQAYQSGQPLINQYGQPYQYAPAYGQGGQVMGPVTPNAYGLGVGMDATGKAVRAVPFP